MRSPSLRKAKILIIDDDADVVEALRAILTQDGYRQIAATTDSGRAMQLFEEFGPDLVVLDLVMPNVSGLQVLKELRALIPREMYLPILVVTGAASALVRHEALTHGASDFVTKPYDATEVVGRIGNLLEARFIHFEPLLETKRFLQATFDALTAEIAILDEHGRIVEVNGGWIRFARENGFVRSRCGVGDNYLQACDAAQGDGASEARAVADGIRAVIAGRAEEFHLEYPCHSAQGRRWFIVRVTRFSADALRVVVAHEDITERRQAEETLQRSQALLRMAGRLGRIGAWAVTLPAMKLTWSDEVYVIHERSLGSAITIAEAMSYYGPDFRERIDRTFTACVRDGTPFDLESEIQTASGRRVSVRSMGEPVRDEVGNIIGVQGAFQDITGQKETEVKFRRNELRLSNILESITDAFVTIDRAWCFTYVNHEAECLYERERSGLLGRMVWDEFTEAVGGAFDRELHRAMQDKITVCFEDYYDPLGKWIEVRAYPSEEGLAVYFRDVTQQRNAREALRMSEERFRMLSEATNDAIWDWDLASGAVWRNDGLKKLYGAGLQEMTMTVDAWIEQIHPDDKVRVIEGIHHAIELGSETWSDEYRLLRRDGGEAYVLDRGHIVRDQQGHALRMIGGVTDLTERRRMEKELRWQTAFLEAQVDSSLDGILVVASDGDRILQNQQMANLMGIPQHIVDDRKDKKQLKWVMSKTRDPEAFLEKVEYLRTHPNETSRDELAFADGTRFDRYSAPVLGKDGTYYGRIWTFRDITERKRMEEELFRSRETLRGILDHIPQRVFWKDRNSVYRGCNRAFALDMGYHDPGEVIGKTDIEAPWQSAAEAYLADDNSVMGLDTPKTSFEEQVILADGRTGWVRTNKIPLHDQQGSVTGILGTYEDVTGHKLAMLEIERLNQELEQRVLQRTADLFAATEEANRANHAKSEFLSRTSHELRTPLHAIVGFGQLLEAEQNHRPETRECISRILDASRYLLTLINEVLNLSGAESGNITLTPGLVAIEPLLDETVALIRPLCAERQIGLNLIHPPEGNWHVLADPQRLKQILLNLISNAIKYNRAGGLVTVEVAPLEAADPPAFRFTVKDTGAGIAPGNLSRLFTPFDRLDVERLKAPPVGTGLGLALSKRMVEMMDGHMGVESVLGEGSTFWFDVPQAHGTTTPAGPLQVPSVTDPGPLQAHSGTVLYIEDTASNLRLIKRVLARRPGIRLLSASTMASGLEAAREHHPDLIVLDLHLPDCQSEELLVRLQHDPRASTIPVIVISADASPGKGEQMLGAGARAYLEKPLDVRAFLDVVDQYIVSSDIEE